MNLADISAHTVDLDLLPRCPVVLDAGSRYFGFSAGVLSVRPDALVFAMEPDPSPRGPMNPPDGAVLIRKALVGDDRKMARYFAKESEEGSFICDGEPPAFHYNYGLTKNALTYQVPCTNIQTLMMVNGIKHWDLVKLDIEGSEFEVLENWQGPIATQITVEFHDWFDRAKWSDQYYADLLASPLKDYEFVQHSAFGIGGGPECGHWDSLLRLKDTVDPTVRRRNIWSGLMRRMGEPAEQ